jgi:hypothetical protein
MGRQATPGPGLDQPVLRAAICAAAILSAAGCSSHERYLITRAQVEALAQAAEGSTPPALPAVRESDHKSVWVRTDALHLSAGTLSNPTVSGETLAIEVRAPNRKISAGAALTWIGTVVSLVGTVLFAVGKVQDQNALFYAGAFTALAAEPIMWTGTGLWLSGALHPPFETSPPRAAGPAAAP